MQTRTRLLCLSGVAIACGVSALGGYSMGQRQGFRMGFGFLETEVNGTLGIRSCQLHPRRRHRSGA